MRIEILGLVGALVLSTSASAVRPSNEAASTPVHSGGIESPRVGIIQIAPGLFDSNPVTPLWKEKLDQFAALETKDFSGAKVAYFGKTRKIRSDFDYQPPRFTDKPFTLIPAATFEQYRASLDKCQGRGHLGSQLFGKFLDEYVAEMVDSVKKHKVIDAEAMRAYAYGIHEILETKARRFVDESDTFEMDDEGLKYAVDSTLESFDTHLSKAQLDLLKYNHESWLYHGQEWGDRASMPQTAPGGVPIYDRLSEKQRNILNAANKIIKEMNDPAESLCEVKLDLTKSGYKIK